MPRKVPSGHGTKSSILYLHSPGVRPKVIVRPSGHPLIQDSLTPLPDPVRTGLPKFSNSPPRARLSWRPRGPQEEDSREIHFLMSRIKLLAKSRLTIVEVMAICIMRGVQPLQYRGNPMWHYNGTDDATRCGRKGPDSATALARILSDLYKGEEEDFLHIKPRDGFSMYNPPNWVSRHLCSRFTYRGVLC